MYMELLKDIYTNSSMTVHLHKQSNTSTSDEEYDREIPYRPGCIRQHSKACTPTTDLGNQGHERKRRISYNSYLRLADNIFICANTPYELQQMLQELADESENQVLKMNKSKTKVMMENDISVYVNNTQNENVQSYVYLGKRYSARDTNQDKEIQRRITAGWTAFAKQRDIFRNNTGTYLKRQVYNSCVLPAMTYGAETWALTS